MKIVDLSILDSIPEISILSDEELTLEGIQEEMINDFESMYESETGEEITLYPADERRILLNAVGGKIFQLAEIINDRFKQNFIKYMYGDNLKNWGANLGFYDTGLSSATCTLEFELSEVQEEDIVIPSGTRATSGNDIFFATDEEVSIAAGELTVQVSATCTTEGTVGNGFLAEQINIIADPIGYVQTVINVDTSSGGHDEYTDDELKLKILNFPSTYSTCGTVDEYASYILKYMDIVDTKVFADNNANVKAYIIRENGVIPDSTFIASTLAYIKDLKCFPDTDKITVLAPTVVNYSINIKYYVDESKKDMLDSIKEQIDEAVSSFQKLICEHIGHAINTDLLISYCGVAGASRIELTSPSYQKIGTTDVAICNNVTVTFGGLEE